MFHPSVRLSSPVWHYVAMAMDALLISACAVVSFRWHFGNQDEAPMLARYSLLVLAAILLMFGFARSTNRSWRGTNLLAMLKPVVTSWVICLMVIIAWLYLSKSSSNVSRLWFITWALSSLATMCLSRLLIYVCLRWLRSKGYNFKNVLIVGHGPSSKFAQKAVKDAPWSGMQIQAVVAPGLVAAHIGRGWAATAR